MRWFDEKLEDEIARETSAGRESLAVWQRVVKSMSGPEKVAKAFELTEMTRQLATMIDSGEFCEHAASVLPSLGA